jgi:hypothetical protein
MNSPLLPKYANRKAKGYWWLTPTDITENNVTDGWELRNMINVKECIFQILAEKMHFTL